MLVVIDTNVLVYLLISGDRTEHARSLLRLDPDWRSEAFIVVELTNVLATQMRVRGLSLLQATEILGHARTVMEAGLLTADHGVALALAAKHGVSAYDARFLAVAEVLGAKLVTEDAN